MAEPFIGEIRLVALSYPPSGWALCDGQLIPINQNQALYSLLGVRYGGDGVNTFGLPDLRGRVPLGVDASGRYTLGQTGGEAAHALTAQEMPAHTHGLSAASAATTADPAGAVLAQPGKAAFAAQAATTMAASTVAPAGQSQPHQNLAPSLALSFIIALQGVFPSTD